MFYLYILLALFIPVEEVHEAHDIHMSRTKIKYIPEEETWQLSMRLFIDDLEATVLERSQIEMKLFSEKEYTDANVLISEYLNEKLIFKVDGTEVEANWVGKEMSEDLAAVWCYMEIPNRPLKSVIQLDNNILHDKFDDQNNIVIVELPNRKKDYFIFYPNRSLETIELK